MITCELPILYLPINCTSQDSTSVVAYPYNRPTNSVNNSTEELHIPQRYFSEKGRNYTVALLLSNDALSIITALQSAVFF